MYATEFYVTVAEYLGLPWWSQTIKCLPIMQETGFDPWMGKSPGEGNGNPLQYSCLGKPKDRGAWWDTAELFQILKDDGVKVLHSI